MPFFSIITVCYNSEKTIERTIQSILHQTFQDYEYIMIDGLSSDKTMDVINKYEPVFQGRLKCVSEKDKGIYDAMNKGIYMASGKIIGIVNSDDYLERDALETVKSYYNPDLKYQIIYGMVKYFNSQGELESVVFTHHRLMEKLMIQHPACFVSKSIYDNKSVFSLDYNSSSDYDFMLKMFYDKEIVFIPVLKILSNFQTGGMSYNMSASIETFKIWRKYGCISRMRYIINLFSLFLKRIVC